MADRYSVTKYVNPDKGYSCCFRQHLAQTHCAFLHGYDLRFEFGLSCDENDRTMEGWVFNFGDFKTIREWLDFTFDHTCLVSLSDPEIELARELHDRKYYQLREVQDTGCEAFAKMVYDVFLMLNCDSFKARKSLRLDYVRVHENGCNSGAYHRPTT